MRLRLLLPCLLFQFTLAANAVAQCRVEGVVTTTSGTPYAGVTVQIDGAEYRQPVTVTAGDDGHFVFRDVKAGTRVRVMATKDGHRVAAEWTLVTQWVETVNLVEEKLNTSPNNLEYLLASDGPTGTIVGYVRTHDGVPANARVTVNETTLGVATDGTGRYAIGGLRAGISVQVHVSAPGFDPASQNVTVPDGRQTSADFSLTASAQSAGDNAPIAAMGTLETPAGDGTVVVPVRELAALPSVNRTDVFRAVQFLPGVAGTLDAALPLAVRGSQPDQTQVTIDGITLYQMGDPASGPTPYDMDSIGHAVFGKSPFAAADGGVVAGALRLTGPVTNGPPTGFVDLSAFGASAGLQVPVGHRLSTSVNVRSSGVSSLYADTLERFSPRIGVSVRDRVPRYSGGSLAAAPTDSAYRDVNARFEATPTTRDRVSFSLYDGDNDLDRSYDVAVPPPPTGSIGIPSATGLPADATIEASKVQSWTSRGWSGIWSREWSSTASSTFGIARSEYSKSASQAWILTSPSTGQDYSDLASRGGSSGLTESNAVNETTFRADTSIALGFPHVVSFGAEVSSYDTSYTAQTEATPVTGSGARASALVDLLRQSDAGHVTALYAHDSWRPLSRLIVSPAVRVVHAAVADANYLEPRVTASYQLRPDLRFTGGWSIDHQVMNRIVREDLSHPDGGFWAVADGTTIPVVRAQQAAAGLNVTRPQISFDLSGFYKSVDHATLFAPRLYTGVAPAAGADLFHEGTGTAAGIESILQYRATRNSMWMAYTLSRAENEYPTLEASTFPAAYDQLSELKVVDAFEIATRWSVSGAFVVGSGRPYTSATGVETVWFPTGDVVEQLAFADKNGARLPAYHRLDVSSERTFTFGRLATSLGGTVFNVYNHDSAIGVEYDTVAGAPVSHDVRQMGRTFNAFVRVKF